VKILIPKRGLKAKLVELALKNCDEILKKSTNYNLVLQEDLAKLLNLKRVPNRVEVFDNSHLFGQAPVGAMVVWESGRWEKSSFRRFNLKFKDEYHQMRELLERRVDNFISSPPPDLWLIDGGENLRLIAKEILKGEGVNIDVVAISKERPDPKSNRVNRAKGGAFDKIYFDGGELRLSKSDKRLLWLQKLRDKVHSFALASHRKKRIKESLEVELLTKKGIGEATLLKLLSYFGSFETIKKASKDELKKVVGERLIEVLMEYQKE
jgi:excinuclease ABC subunit C